MVRYYITYVLVITKYDFEVHMKALDKVLQKLAELRLKINSKESFFGQMEPEYLGLWVINNRARPI